MPRVLILVYVPVNATLGGNTGTCYGMNMNGKHGHYASVQIGMSAE